MFFSAHLCMRGNKIASGINERVGKGTSMIAIVESVTHGLFELQTALKLGAERNRLRCKRGVID